MLKLAFRNLFRHRLRNGLTLAAIVLGVVGLILTGGFVEDVFERLRENTIHSQLGHVQVNASGYRALGRRDPYRYLLRNPGEVMTEIKAQPHVVDVMARLRFSALASNGRADLPVIGEGAEPEKEARLASALSMVSGRSLAAVDSFGVVVGQGVARALQLTPGDTLTLLANTADGALNSLEFEVTGIFQSFSKDFDNRAVRVTLAAAQELLVSPGAHTIVVALDDSAAADATVSRLRALLDGHRYEVFAWHDLADFYNKTVDMYRQQFGFLKIVILILVLLSVANSVSMAVYERTGEMGTLMALGRRPRQVFALVLTENTILGLLGAIIGVAGGLILAWLISTLGIQMPPPPNSNMGYVGAIRVVPSVVWEGFAIGMIATVMASILPARRVANLAVAKALRFNL